jgi:hypothetical protein
LAKEVPLDSCSSLQCRQLHRDALEEDVNCKNINFKSTNYVKFKGDNEEREDCMYLEVGSEVVAGGWKLLIGLSLGSPWKLRQPTVHKKDDAGANAVYSYKCKYTM